MSARTASPPLHYDITFAGSHSAHNVSIGDVFVLEAHYTLRIEVELFAISRRTICLMKHFCLVHMEHN